MPVGSAPDRQEANSRNSCARSQRSESYRRPKQEWQREEEKSRIRSRSKFIKDSVTYQQQTNKQRACLKVTRESACPQGLDSTRRPRYNHRHNYQRREGVRKKSYSDQLPINVLAPVIPYHKRRVQERGQKRTDEDCAKTKNARVSKAPEANRSANEIARQARADQCFARVADEPAQNHHVWDVTLQLRCAMRRKRGQQDEPPDARWRQQKCCDQNRIRRPKDRDRMGLKRERESDFRAEIITDKDACSAHNCAKIERYIPNARILGRRL